MDFFNFSMEHHYFTKDASNTNTLKLNIKMHGLTVKSNDRIMFFLFNLGRPFSETLFFKGAQETGKQVNKGVCYVNQKHRGKPPTLPW